MYIGLQAEDSSLATRQLLPAMTLIIAITKPLGLAEELTREPSSASRLGCTLFLKHLSLLLKPFACSTPRPRCPEPCPASHVPVTQSRDSASGRRKCFTRPITQSRLPPATPATSFCVGFMRWLANLYPIYMRAKEAAPSAAFLQPFVFQHLLPEVGSISLPSTLISK